MAVRIRYDYFNLDDKNVFRDHEPLIAPAPKCDDGAHFYYKEKKLSFTKTDEVYKRALQAAKKGKMLTFHWRGGYLTREVLGELLDEIRKAGAEKGKQAVVSLNWPAGGDSAPLYGKCGVSRDAGGERRGADGMMEKDSEAYAVGEEQRLYFLRKKQWANPGKNGIIDTLYKRKSNRQEEDIVWHLNLRAG